MGHGCHRGYKEVNLERDGARDPTKLANKLLVSYHYVLNVSCKN